MMKVEQKLGKVLLKMLGTVSVALLLIRVLHWPLAARAKTDYYDGGRFYGRVFSAEFPCFGAGNSCDTCHSVLSFLAVSCYANSCTNPTI